MDKKRSIGQKPIDPTNLFGVYFSVPRYNLPKFQDPDEQSPIKRLRLVQRRINLQMGAS